MQSTETGRTPHGPSPSVSFTHEDSNVFRFAIAVLSAFAVLATANAQYITTPGCPNGLCPRLQQAIPAAFPAQPLIQIGQPAPIQGYWTTPGVQPWTGPLPLTVPAPMPGPLTPPSPSPTPTPVPSPVAPSCTPILFPNFQPFGGRFRLSCRCRG